MAPCFSPTNWWNNSEPQAKPKGKDISRATLWRYLVTTVPKSQPTGSQKLTRAPLDGGSPGRKRRPPTNPFWELNVDPNHLGSWKNTLIWAKFDVWQSQSLRETRETRETGRHFSGLQNETTLQPALQFAE